MRFGHNFGTNTFYTDSNPSYLELHAQQVKEATLVNDIMNEQMNKLGPNPFSSVLRDPKKLKQIRGIGYLQIRQSCLKVQKVQLVHGHPEHPFHHEVQHHHGYQGVPDYVLIKHRVYHSELTNHSI